jgi:hypothetical protein
MDASARPRHVRADALTGPCGRSWPCRCDGASERARGVGGAGGNWLTRTCQRVRATSTRTHFFTVGADNKARPRGKCGHPNYGHGHQDGKFYHRTSVLTSLPPRSYIIKCGKITKKNNDKNDNFL